MIKIENNTPLEELGIEEKEPSIFSTLRVHICIAFQHLRVHDSKLLILQGCILNKLGLVGVKSHLSRITSIQVLAAHDPPYGRIVSGTHCPSDLLARHC